MSQTDDLPALLETPFGLFHECPGDDDSEGWQEFLDCPGYTADQMRAYATAARAPLLERIKELEAKAGRLLSALDMLHEGTTYGFDGFQNGNGVECGKAIDLAVSELRAALKGKP